MVGWHHQLDGHESEQALGVGDGQEAMVHKVHGFTKGRIWLNDLTELNMGSEGWFLAPKLLNHLYIWELEKTWILIE